MIQLSQEAKDLFNTKIKSYLKRNDVEGAIQFLLKQNDGSADEVLAGLAEMGVILPALNNINAGLFEATGITTITIPGNIERIGASAFKNCKELQSVTIEEGVDEIMADAFSGCANLKSVRLPESLTKLGSSAFKGCSSLTAIYLPDSINVLPKGLFEGCDRVVIEAHSRKNMPKRMRLVCPQPDIEWYKQHLKVKKDDGEDE